MVLLSQCDRGNTVGGVAPNITQVPVVLLISNECGVLGLILLSCMGEGLGRLFRGYLTGIDGGKSSSSSSSRPPLRPLRLILFAVTVSAKQVSVVLGLRRVCRIDRIVP